MEEFSPYNFVFFFLSLNHMNILFLQKNKIIKKPYKQPDTLKNFHSPQGLNFGDFDSIDIAQRPTFFNKLPLVILL